MVLTPSPGLLDPQDSVSADEHPRIDVKDSECICRMSRILEYIFISTGWIVGLEAC